MVVDIEFKDHDDNLVTPVTATWTLSDVDGVIVNSRENVTISSLATSVSLVLSGDDLAVSDALGVDRIFTLKATYNSSLGNGLTLNEEEPFTVKNLVNVS